jgi:hypothetical protein
MHWVEYAEVGAWTYWADNDFDDHGDVVGYVGRQPGKEGWFCSLNGGEEAMTLEEAKATTEVLYRMGQVQIW